MPKWLSVNAIACLGLYFLSSSPTLAKMPIQHEPKLKGISLSCHLQVINSFQNDREIQDSNIKQVVEKYLEAEQLGDRSKFIAKIFQILNNIKAPLSRDGVISEIYFTYANAGQYDISMQFINAVKNAEFKAFLLADIATKYAEEKQTIKALNSLAEALKLSQQIKDDDLQDKLLGKIVEGYATAKDFNRAINITNNIKEISVRAKSLTNIAKLEIKVGNKERANKLLNESMQAIASLEIRRYRAGAFIVSSPINKLPQKKTPVFDKSYLLAATAVEYENLGIANQALQLIEKIEDPEIKAYILTQVVESYLQAGLYEKALKLADGIGGIDKLNELNLLNSLYNSVKKLEQAADFALSINEPYTRSKALINVASNYIRKDQKSKAIGLLQQAQNITINLTDISEKLPLMVEIADNYAKIGEKAEVNNILDEAKNLVKIIKVQEDEEFLQKILIDIVAVYVTIEQREQAIKLITTINTNDGKVLAWRVIAHRYLEKGQYEQAFQAIKQLKSQFPADSDLWNDFILGDIAGYYAEQKQFAQANKIAQNIKSQSEQYKWIELIKCASEQSS